MRRTPLALALGMAWGLLPLVVMAQQDTHEETAAARGPNKGVAALSEVVVSDFRGAQVERRNSGIQKIVIAEEDVERYGDATVGDVLRRLPGMTFTGPAGVSKDIRMRGLEKGYTQFMINGEPVPGATQERQMQVDRLPADMIERIEIIRNASAEYDAAAVGGTINIVLKNKAEDVTRLRAAYGKNGSMDVGDVVMQWSHRYDDLDAVLALSHTVGAEDVVENKATLNAAGVVTARENKPKPVKKTETLLTPRLTLRLGGDSLTFDPYISSGTEDKLESARARTAAGVLTKGTDKNEKKNDLLGRMGVRYDAKTAWGSWNARLGAQQGRSSKDAYSIETNGAGVVTKRSQEIENIYDDQVYAGMGLGIPLGSHTLKSGVENRLTDYEKNKTAAEASNATNPLAPKAAGANDIYTIQERKSAVYVQDEWHLADDHWLTPGIRYEFTNRNASDRNGLTSPASHVAPNPSLHYRWAIQKDLVFRSSLAQTLKLPKFDLVNPQVTTKSGTLAAPDEAGNAELRPELATGLEIGMEKFFQGNRGVVGLNFYQRDVKDYIEKDTRLEGARWVKRPYNAGNARIWGAELDLRVPLVNKGPHELTFTGNHSEMRGLISSAVSGQTYTVKDMAPSVTNVGLDWRHQPSKWSAGFTINFSPRYTTQSVNDDGLREVKTRNESTLLDIYIQKVFSPKAELRLIAKNLLAIKKEESTTKYNANGSFNAAEAKVESSQPTLYVTLESRF
jgi:iron complex outermembrane receptor protein